MSKVIVNKDKCPQNHRCLAIMECPVSAIHQNKFDLPVVDYDKCVLCQKCTFFCPKGALQIQY